MNTAKQVDSMIADWKKQGLSKDQIVVRTANACLGWCYVWGALGQLCTTSVRNSHMKSSNITQGDIDYIKKKCPRLSGGKGSCAGCTYYPGNSETRVFDCRGFTYWVLKQVGITLQGGGATSQWNTKSNWESFGTIDTMPKDKVCCIFRYYSSTNKMEHTLLYDGAGNYIHCSGEVKKQATSTYPATHWAIPKGLYSGGGSGGGGGGKTVEKATVYAEKGSTVNMRKSQSIISSIVKQVPIGASINVTQRGSDWTAVEYGGKTGYMMTKFLVFAGEDKYTCTISKLTKAQADKLAEQYKNCVITQG